MEKYLKGIRVIDQIHVSEKVVFLRLDLNVPIRHGVIEDTTRIQESLPTIKYLLEQKSKVIIASHLGRPKNKDDKKYSMLPVGEKLAELLNVEVILAEDPSPDFMKPTLKGLTKKQIIVQENLRFFEGETENSVDLARIWASYSDVYINDAFGASHRAHASIEALPRLMQEKGCGFLIQKELKYLGRILDRPERPFAVILGGAKVSDKIPVLENLIDRLDFLFVGGAMAYTFLKAAGVPVGRSLVEVDQLNYCRELLERFKARHKHIFLPIDHKVADQLEMPTITKVTEDEKIPEGLMGLDIGPKTLESYQKALNQARTIFWNGPMGVFEKDEFAVGTLSLARFLAQLKGVFRVIGGGDSASAVNRAGVAQEFDHVSTGGGASLEFLQGNSLPGIEVLRDRRLM
ncbi:MAG: phosphoglycerate kinase [Bdellovibrionaceae bacterium]|nr:phosphoglycerate kinase [Pseudobdellovibrionaceae bacterium]MDW8189807.1 phosphoglycerate kinase [Pseudobdellovibrionaceae bacterium]